MRPAALLVLVSLVLATASATHSQGSGPRSLGGETVPDQPILVTLEAEQFVDRANGTLVSDPGATGGKAWKLAKYGAIHTDIEIPTTGVVWVEIRARGEHPEGLFNTHMHPLLDGAQRGEWDLPGAEWKTYRQSVPVLAGRHEFGVDNFNNYHAPALDRTLYVDWVKISMPTLEGSPRVGPGRVVVDAPDIHAAGTGQSKDNPDAREGTEWIMWGIGCFVETIVLQNPGEHSATPRLRGNERNSEGSHVTVLLDGRRLDEYFAGDAWMERTTKFTATAGAHVLEICYDNDYGGDLKRNLYMDDLVLEGPEGGSTPPPDPAPIERGSWRVAHGGPTNHRAAPSALTLDNADDLTVAWRYPTDAAVTGTPVHDDGVAYFADWSGKVHAVRIEDGERVWRVDHGVGVDSSLAIDGDRVIVGDMDGRLSARDRGTGALLWSRDMDVEGTHLYGSPVPHEGRIYLGVASEQTDLTYEGPQTFRGSVAAVEAATGKLLWQTYMQPPDGRGVSVWSTPALDPARNLLYVGTGNAYGAPAGTRSDAIVALRMSDGAIAWSFQATANDTFNARGSPGPDYDFGASPVLVEAGGRALVLDGDKGGRFYALDRETGEEVWRTKADFVAAGASLVEKEGFIGTAAYADGLVFGPTTDRSMVHAFDVATGEIEWATEVNEKPSDYGERMFGSTSVSGGVVLQGNAFGKLSLLDARTGRILAQHDVGGDVQGGVSLAGDLVLVPHGGEQMWDAEGGVVAFRIPRATENDPPPVTSTPPPTGGTTSTPPTGGPSTTVPTGTTPGTPTEEIPLESTIPWGVGLALAAVGLAAMVMRRSRR